MTATVLREAGAKAESPNEDAQIAIYGSSTSTNNAMAYITLDISGDDFDLRASGSSNGGGSTAGFVEDQEFNIEVAWDASAASDTVAPLVTVTVDGQVAFGGAAFASPSADLTSVSGGVATIQFRVGGTGDVTAFGFIVDDFNLYSSDSGSEVEVFSDDFEIRMPTRQVLHRSQVRFQILLRLTTAIHSMCLSWRLAPLRLVDSAQQAISMRAPLTEPLMMPVN
jgi:hypothetical protein